MIMVHRVRQPYGKKFYVWLMIIVMILSLFSVASLISFMSSTGELQTPTEIVQKGTSYF